jgi:hypothetical protein
MLTGASAFPINGCVSYLKELAGTACAADGDLEKVPKAVNPVTISTKHKIAITILRLLFLEFLRDIYYLSFDVLCTTF